MAGYTVLSQTSLRVILEILQGALPPVPSRGGNPDSTEWQGDRPCPISHGQKVSLAPRPGLHYSSGSAFCDSGLGSHPGSCLGQPPHTPPIPGIFHCSQMMILICCQVYKPWIGCILADLSTMELRVRAGPCLGLGVLCLKALTFIKHLLCASYFIFSMTV